MEKIRINNIECRKYTATKTDIIHYEIIKWYKNDYYNKKSEMINNEFRECLDGITNGIYTIHNSCFKNEYSCYTIASLHLDIKESDVYLKSVGSRLTNLSKNDLNDFIEVYIISNKKIKKIHFN